MYVCAQLCAEAPILQFPDRVFRCRLPIFPRHRRNLHATSSPCVVAQPRRGETARTPSPLHATARGASSRVARTTSRGLPNRVRRQHVGIVTRHMHVRPVLKHQLNAVNRNCHWLRPPSRDRRFKTSRALSGCVTPHVSRVPQERTAPVASQHTDFTGGEPWHMGERAHAVAQHTCERCRGCGTLPRHRTPQQQLGLRRGDTAAGTRVFWRPRHRRRPSGHRHHRHHSWIEHAARTRAT